ncbi:MAG: L-glutamate gamma-semialdehyde dehydrogenase, partial [Planctomycetes bacterium]|nr:L-glutamate gamma-semialdehyde dehydrogenase [Planctomycetota bacterium]
MADPDLLEARTVAIGHELFAASHRLRPRFLTRGWLDDQAMAWTMRDERLKVQLFRFVDALPGLRTPEQINRHLGEYLGPVRGQLPALARWALERAPHDDLIGGVVAGAAGFGARQLARKFIVG